MKKALVIGGAVLIVAVVCIAVVAQRGRDPVQGMEALAASTAGASTAPAPSPASAVEATGVESAVPVAQAPDSGSGLAAIRQAAEANKHLFVFVYAADDELTRAARKTVESAMAKMPDTAQWVAVDRGAPAEKGLVDIYRLGAAPMPLVLVVAPNGAITGGIVGPQVNEEALQNALASPCMQKCLKALQEGKLVFLCAQNKTTTANEAAMKGVNDFKADVRFAKFTEIVQVDPADAAEGKFLAQLKIEPKADEAVTAFLAPPGAIVATYTGATDKNTLVTAITTAASGGCGPSGCGPASSGCN
jgi:hypothetical protein